MYRKMLLILAAILGVAMAAPGTASARGFRGGGFRGGRGFGFAAPAIGLGLGLGLGAGYYGGYYPGYYGGWYFGGDSGYTYPSYYGIDNPYDYAPDYYRSQLGS